MEKEKLIKVYPALNKCLVLESRHSVRTEMMKFLDASSLFNEIIIADSIPDGIKKVAAFDFDACLVGTTVSPTAADDFFEKAEKGTKSKDCAFIVLINADVDLAQNLYIFNKSNPHGQVSFPCTKRAFTDGIVKSIIAANVNSPWRSLYESNLLILEDDIISSSHNKELTKTEASNNENVTVTLILIESFGMLDKIIEGVNMGLYSLNKEGKPDGPSAEALEKVFLKLFEVRGNSKKVADFMNIFRNSLDKWFFELLTSGADEANKNFKSSLFSFIKTNK